MSRNRMEAMLRMLSDSGDITPMGVRQIQNVLDAEEESEPRKSLRLRRIDEISPDEQFSVNVTDEGVIFDAFLAGECIGTMGLTFSEWFDYVKGR